MRRAALMLAILGAVCLAIGQAPAQADHGTTAAAVRFADFNPGHDAVGIHQVRGYGRGYGHGYGHYGHYGHGYGYGHGCWGGPVIVPAPVYAPQVVVPYYAPAPVYHYYPRPHSGFNYYGPRVSFGIAF